MKYNKFLITIITILSITNSGFTESFEKRPMTRPSTELHKSNRSFSHPKDDSVAFAKFRKTILSNNLAENFTLLDHTGKSHELYYYSDRKAIVLISQGNGCPIVRHSIPTLNQIKAEFEPQGVTFLMINANPQDDRFVIAQEAREFNITIPILEDRAQIIAESLNITRTAEALLIDTSSWAIRYHGAIDDRLGYETQKKQAKNNYLKDAITALLAGKDIATPSTPIKGCLINFEHKSKAATYTYNQHVAPILQKKCLKCHSPGGMAPWAMKEYQTVKGWGAMIREVVRTKRMPPFKPDPYYGKFENDVSLNPDEIRTIVHWIEQGFRKDENRDYLKQAPQPKHKEWPVGPPDIILSVKEEQHIPPTGILPYRYIEADKIIEKGIWLKAAHLKPSNPKVLHHARIITQPPDTINKGMPNETKAPMIRNEDKQLSAEFTLRRQDFSFAGYKPGSEPFLYPDETGIFIPQGSKMVFQLHYTPTGRPESDTTKIGLYLHSQRPLRSLMGKRIENDNFLIPANKKDHKVTASAIFDDESVAYIVTPHMHYRGKSMEVIAEYPDGISETLISVPEYDFNWQHWYTFRKPKIFPAGTRIVCNGTFDNSAQNPQNPDPSKIVKWGLQSDDEMFRCLFYTIKSQKN